MARLLGCAGASLSGEQHENNSTGAARGKTLPQEPGGSVQSCEGKAGCEVAEKSPLSHTKPATAVFS